MPLEQRRPVVRVFAQRVRGPRHVGGAQQIRVIRFAGEGRQYFLMTTPEDDVAPDLVVDQVGVQDSQGRGWRHAPRLMGQMVAGQLAQQIIIVLRAMRFQIDPGVFLGARHAVAFCEMRRQPAFARGLRTGQHNPQGHRMGSRFQAQLRPAARKDLAHWNQP